MQPENRRLLFAVSSRLLLSLVVGVLFVAACATPVYDEGPSRDYGDIQIFGRVHYGIVALLLGWMIPIPWFANILLFIGWIVLLCKQNTVAMGFGIAAILFGLTTHWFITETLLISYYLWQASMLVFTLGALIIRWQESKQKRELSTTPLPTITEPIPPKELVV